MNFTESQSLASFGGHTVVALSLPMRNDRDLTDRIRASMSASLAALGPQFGSPTFFGKELVAISPAAEAVLPRSPVAIAHVEARNEAFGLFRAMVLGKFARLAERHVDATGSQEFSVEAHEVEMFISAAFVPTPPLLPNNQSALFEAPESCLEIDAVGFTSTSGDNASAVRRCLTAAASDRFTIDWPNLYAARLQQNALLQSALAWLGSALGTLGLQWWPTQGDSLLCEPDRARLGGQVDKLNSWLGGLGVKAWKQRGVVVGRRPGW